MTKARAPSSLLNEPDTLSWTFTYRESALGDVVVSRDVVSAQQAEHGQGLSVHAGGQVPRGALFVAPTAGVASPWWWSLGQEGEGHV